MQKTSLVPNPSIYFKVAAWPCGSVAENKIYVNFNCGSMAAWPRGSNYCELEKKY